MFTVVRNVGVGAGMASGHIDDLLIDAGEVLTNPLHDSAGTDHDPSRGRPTHRRDLGRGLPAGMVTERRPYPRWPARIDVVREPTIRRRNAEGSDDGSN